MKLQRGEKALTKHEKENWLCNIRNAAREVATYMGEDSVQHVLRRYDATSIEDLCPSYYAEVFEELDFIANDASG